MKPFLILAGFLLCILGCSESGQNAGGPGSETTNGIYATVLTGDFPAKGAAVALRKSDFIPMDSSTEILRPDFFADSLGHIDIPLQDSGLYRLTISLGGKVFSSEIHIDKAALDLGEIRLETPGTLSGKILAKAHEEFWVGAYGLDILERIDSSGNFLLAGLPAGDLKIFVLSANKDSVVADTSLSISVGTASDWNLAPADTVPQLSPDTTTADTTSKVPPDTSSADTTVSDTAAADTALWMLYEDFEDSASFAAKAWYFSADTLSTIFSPTDFAWNGVLKDSVRGNVFTGTYQAKEGSYVLFGKSLSPSVDLSALDSIVFYAKGSGALRVSLERWEASASDNLKAWTDEIAITSTWARIVVTPNDFLSAESDSLSTGWESVRETVSRVHFFAVNGTEISLDDIAIYGATF